MPLTKSQQTILKREYIFPIIQHDSFNSSDSEEQTSALIQQKRVRDHANESPMTLKEVYNAINKVKNDVERGEAMTTSLALIEDINKLPTQIYPALKDLLRIFVGASTPFPAVEFDSDAERQELLNEIQHFIDKTIFDAAHRPENLPFIQDRTLGKITEFKKRPTQPEIKTKTALFLTLPHEIVNTEILSFLPLSAFAALANTSQGAYRTVIQSLDGIKERKDNNRVYIHSGYHCTRIRGVESNITSNFTHSEEAYNRKTAKPRHTKDDKPTYYASFYDAQKGAEAATRYETIPKDGAKDGQSTWVRKLTPIIYLAILQNKTKDQIKQKTIRASVPTEETGFYLQQLTHSSLLADNIEGLPTKTIIIKTLDDERATTTEPLVGIAATNGDTDSVKYIHDLSSNRHASFATRHNSPQLAPTKGLANLVPSCIQKLICP